MHHCPECGEPCFCDCDDTDFGIIPLGGFVNCDHVCDNHVGEDEEFPKENED